MLLYVTVYLNSYIQLTHLMGISSTAVVAPKQPYCIWSPFQWDNFCTTQQLCGVCPSTASHKLVPPPDTLHKHVQGMLKQATWDDSAHWRANAGHTPSGQGCYDLVCSQSVITCCAGRTKWPKMLYVNRWRSEYTQLHIDMLCRSYIRIHIYKWSWLLYLVCTQSVMKPYNNI